MSDLEKALAEFDTNGGWHGVKNRRAIIDAARRQLNLTSPETIEKAAKAAYEAMRGQRTAMPLWEGNTEYVRGLWLDWAEAVLRSVEEGTP